MLLSCVRIRATSVVDPHARSGGGLGRWTCADRWHAVSASGTNMMEVTLRSVNEENFQDLVLMTGVLMIAGTRRKRGRSNIQRPLVEREVRLDTAARPAPTSVPSGRSSPALDGFSTDRAPVGHSPAGNLNRQHVPRLTYVHSARKFAGLRVGFLCPDVAHGKASPGRE
jgi:hypothetical protein